MPHSSSRRRKSTATAQAKRHQPPGAPIYTGEPREDQVRVTVLDYTADQVREAEQVAAEALAPFASPATVTWINVDGLHQVDVVQRVCATFGVHPLVVEDLLNTSTRPKVEEYGDQIAAMVRMAQLVRGTAAEDDCAEVCVDVDAIAVIAGPGWVLTFQERPGDLWDGVRNRLREGRGRIRQRGSDYLLHALLDAIVDGYIEVIEAYELRVEALEEEVLEERPERNGRIPRRAHLLRGELHTLRRMIWPFHEGVGAILRGQIGHITPEVLPFYRDLHDHLAKALDHVDANRDRLLGAVDLHLSLASHRMNDTMRVLTVVATIFIPLTFVVGIYGMNFQHMPELRHPAGYPAVMLGMLAIALGMVAWFHRKGWL